MQKTMRETMRAFRAGLYAFTAMLLVNGGARADAVSDFYTGRTVNMIIGLGAGGTYDLYARAIARHLGRYIPGNPRVNIQQMPGAASYTAAVHVFNIAPQDGTAIPYKDDCAKIVE